MIVRGIIFFKTFKCVYVLHFCYGSLVMCTAMPYADVLDWSTFAEALDWSEIRDLGRTLAARDVPAMRMQLHKVRPMFSIDGLIAYMVFRLAHWAPTDSQATRKISDHADEVPQPPKYSPENSKYNCPRPVPSRPAPATGPKPSETELERTKICAGLHA